MDFNNVMFENLRYVIYEYNQRISHVQKSFEPAKIEYWAVVNFSARDDNVRALCVLQMITWLET